MRTTIDLPDPVLRQLKSRAALDGITLKDLVQSLIQRALELPPALPQAGRPALPSLRSGHPLALREPSNAGLFELLDEG